MPDVATELVVSRAPTRDDDNGPRWLSRRQTMAYLNISENTLDRLIARRAIKSFLLGHKRIIPLSEIAEYEARKLAEADTAGASR